MPSADSGKRAQSDGCSGSRCRSGDAGQIFLLELDPTGARLVEAELARLPLHRFALVHGVALDEPAGIAQLLERDLLGAQPVCLPERLAHGVAQLRGLQRDADDRQPRIHGRVAARLHLGAKQAIAFHRAEQPRRVAVSEHQRERVERGHVVAAQRRSRPRKRQVALLENVAPHAHGGVIAPRLLRPRSPRRRLRRWPDEQLARQIQDVGLAHVPDDDQHAVRRLVPAPVEGENPVASERADALLRADDRPPVRMLAERGGEKLSRQLARGRVEAPLDLLAHHFDLAPQLLGIERGGSDRVGEHVHALREELAGDHHVVDGLVEAGPGVDLAAGLLDVARDLSRPAPRGALEEHVLVQVRQAGLAGQLVGAAHPDPHLHRSDGSGVVLLDEDRQSVGQAVAHENLARKRCKPGAGSRPGNCPRTA